MGMEDIEALTAQEPAELRGAKDVPGPAAAQLVHGQVGLGQLPAGARVRAAGQAHDELIRSLGRWVISPSANRSAPPTPAR